MSYIGNPIVSTDFPVDYFSGNGSTAAFTLSVAPASVNSIDVQVSGVSQSPQTYSVSGTTLTFSAAPPTGSSNIVVRHLGVAGIPNTPSAASVVQTSLASNVAGTGPAFSAYASNGQSCAASTATKITFGTTRYDTNSNFSSSRFTPTVAGYYQISAAVTLNANVNNVGILGCIYKNGGSYACGSATGTGAQYPTATVSATIYMNGSTDYVEIYVFNSGGSTYTVVGGVLVTADSTWFTGALVRAA